MHLFSISNSIYFVLFILFCKNFRCHLMKRNEICISIIVELKVNIKHINHLSNLKGAIARRCWSVSTVRAYKDKLWIGRMEKITK